MSNRLREGLENGEFVVTCEMIPRRGARIAIRDKMLEESEKMVKSGRVHAVSITDNPGGNPALEAETFAEDMLERGITPLVHMSCKDRNRSMLMSSLYTMENRGIENILTMTGDFPFSGWAGMGRPVFDLDPVQLLQMIKGMNEGLRVAGPKEVNPSEDAKTEEPAHFFMGACVSPFKYNEGEQIPQYYKLDKKIRAGAKFVISQVGYDARKMQELILYMQEKHYGHIPAIANIYVLRYGAAKYMAYGGVPGVSITKEFLKVLRQERDNSDDKGQEASLVRAAKMIAIARGFGFRGCHLGSPNLTADQAFHILDMADEFQENWEELVPELQFGMENGFYYYKEQPDKPGFNSLDHSERPENHYERAIQKHYGLSRVFHKMMFTPGKNFFPIFHKREVSLEKKYDRIYGEGKGRYRPHGLEHIGKTFLFHCMDCGDCGLYATAYVCPMTECPKCQRNGPCGGSYDGWCEVYPNEKRCIYYRAYYRLKKYGDEAQLGDWIIQPNNWDTWQTSPWSNYHHGRDNIRRRKRITPWREGEHKEAPFEEWGEEK